MAYGAGYAGGYADAVEQQPTLLVELSTAQPTAAPVWVDLAADLIEVRTTRGRRRELDRFRAGTFTVVLDNRAAKYSPDNAGSPYAGHIKPMRRIRVRATYGGTTYPIIDGYIDSIEQEYEGPNNARAVISATDAFKVLAAAELPASAYAAEVLADGPVAWWRLDEPDGTVAHDGVGTADLTLQGTAALGADTLVARDPGGALEIPAASAGLLGPQVITGGPFTAEFLFATDALTDGVMVGQWSYSTSGAIGVAYEGFEFVLHPGGAFFFIIYKNGVSTSAVAGSLLPIMDGAVHHFVGVWDTTNTIRLYFDGVEVGTNTLTVGSWSALGETLVGGCVGVYDEIAFYNYALSPTRIAAHHEAVATPWNDDLSGERAQRILDIIGWPADRTDLDDGKTVFQSADIDGTNTLAYLQKVAESEFGALFVTRDGTVRFLGREAAYNREELYTFSDDPVGADQLPYMALTPEYSDALIRNEVTVSRFDGVAQTVRDDTSIAEYLPHSYVVEGLLHDTDEHSRYAAQFIVSEYSEPKRRISRLVVNPREADHIDDLFPAVLGLELLDEVTVIERPPGSDTITQDSVIEGVSHHIRPLSWQTSFQLSPAYTDSFWQVGVPGRSEIGVTTRVGF